MLNISNGRPARSRAVLLKSAAKAANRIALISALSTTALHAQNRRAPVQDEVDSDEIVVTGAPPRGSVPGDIKPEQQLSPADIRSYGVSSISDLLNELAPETNASGGTPVVLLNGKRISGFAEIQDLPTEAISRVEILPEEVSLKFGYQPNQKVVNIVLRQRFRAETGELRGATTTDGGRESGSAIGNFLRIRGDNRLTVGLQYNGSSSLLESERNIDPTPPRFPYSAFGNVTAVPGSGSAELDPTLSALAGTPVTIAGVPASASLERPSLSDFLTGANNPNASQISNFRTLSPSTQNVVLNAVLARTLPGNISGSLNGRVEFTDSISLQGLPTASLLLPAGNPYSPFSGPVQLYRYIGQADPLEQNNRSINAHLGLTLNGDIKPWLWSFTGSYDRNDTRTETDRGISTTDIQAAIAAGDPTVNPFGLFGPALLSNRLADRAHAISSDLTGDLLLNGPLFSMPAGKVTTSIRLGVASNSFDGDSVRSGVTRSTDFSRTTVSGQMSIDVPITSRKNGVLAAIGDLSLNGNVASQHLSDFGTLTTLGYGLNWAPIPQIRFIASMSQDRAAPSGQQVENPQIITPNYPIFDYVTGRTVYVSQLSGGNPGLVDSDRHQLRFNVTVKPLSKTDLTFVANYTRSRTDNPIAAFPSPTSQIEAAFPDRFVRDADGTLLQVDTRPINFANSRSSQLRWGFNLSLPIKSHIQKEIEAWRAAGAKPEDRPADLNAMLNSLRSRARQEAGSGSAGAGQNQSAGGQPNGSPRGGGGGGFGGFGGGGRGGGGGGGGRLQFALYHIWHFTDSVLVAPGMPRLDLLDGATIGSGGGQPRHELQAQAGYSNNGLGLRASANWQSGTDVNGASGTPLHFSSLATVNLRLFANLTQMPQLVQAHPFLRGSRITLSITNLFNGRQTVTDATGTTPLKYQPAYLDPAGRTIALSFRKLFF